MRFANAEIEVVAIACARGTLVLAGLRGGVPSEKRSKRGEAHETSPPPELREVAPQARRHAERRAGWAGYLAQLAPELAPNSTG